MNEYLSTAYSQLRHMCEKFPVLDTNLHEFELEIAQPTERQKLHKHIVDYFYHLLALEPFITFINTDKNKMQNLVVFSDFLQTFQNYYHYDEISFENCGKLASDFFNKFLSLLYEDGINQYENPKQPFPEEHVPVITIHQAKGLEFPVVVVGSLDRGIPGLEAIDKQLQRFYRRSKPELELSISAELDQDIPTFDFLRLYYVAFSRAMHLLVLTGNLHKRPSPNFDKILRGLPQWRDGQSHLSSMTSFPMNDSAGKIGIDIMPPRAIATVQKEPEDAWAGARVQEPFVAAADGCEPS
jgi:DNA helicase II / ATP-dependent DNA helicase PcrA